MLVNFYRTITTTPRGASFSSGRTPPEGSSNFNYLTYDSTGPSQQSATDKSKGNDKEKGSEKKRLSSGLGSMLLNRRSQGLDRDETANLL